MAVKKVINWRKRYEITAEVQADLRKKGITINSKRVLAFRLNDLKEHHKNSFRSLP